MLELDQVVKRYRTGAEEVRAVDGVSLSLNAGEMLALQGPSGSGKTTLLLLAAAVLRADAGSVRFQGRDLSGLDEREVAQYRLSDIGLVSQSARLMTRVSAVDNAATKLLLGGLAASDALARAGRWLELVGMGEKAARTPEELSGGERQRVAIASALVGDPTLILADEPTANLDSERSREIVALLGELARVHGKGVLLVTHDPDAATAADRVLRLRDGRLQLEDAWASRG